MYRRKDMTIDHYSTATAMLAALRRRAISSTELVDMHIARIEAYDGTLNAIPVRTFDRARQAVQQADERIAAGDTAPLLGLPMTLKESTLTAGLPQSAGMLHCKDYRPAIDGPIATRVFGAGAGLLGQYLCHLRKAEGGLSGMNTTQAGDLVENLA